MLSPFPGAGLDFIDADVVQLPFSRGLRRTLNFATGDGVIPRRDPRRTGHLFNFVIRDDLVEEGALLAEGGM